MSARHMRTDALRRILASAELTLKAIRDGEVDALVRLILDQAAEAIVVCDREGRIVLASQAAQRLCGTNPILQSFRQVLPLRRGQSSRPWHRVERRKQPRRAPFLPFEEICTGEAVRDVPAHLDRDDTRRDLVLNAAPLLGAEDALLGCIITLVDVTDRTRVEHALAESQSRFERLSESNLIGILSADADTILDANDALLDILGYSREDLRAGRIRWREMTPPEYHGATERKIEQLRTGGTSTPYEKEYVRKDGTRVPVLIGGVLLDATPFRWVGFVVDLSRRKRAERALRLSEDRFAKAFRASPDAQVITRLADGHVVEVNESWEQLSGYSRAEASAGMAHDLGLLVEPEVAHHILRELREGRPVRDFETAILARSGEARQVSVSAELIEVDGAECLLAILRDITERRRLADRLREANETLEQRVAQRTAELEHLNRALEMQIAERRRTEEALEASRSDFESLLESAPDAILSVDAGGRIVLVNGETEKMFGYTRAELLGLPVEVLLPERFRSEHVRHRGDYAGAPSTRPMGIGLDLLGRRKDGTEFPVEISLSPVSRPDGMHVMSIIRDITARKRAEEILSESEQRFRTLVQQVSDYAIFRLDLGGQVISWNVGAERMYGYTEEEILGRHFACFYLPEDRQRGKPARELAIASEQGTYREVAQRVRKDGSAMWADVVITAIHDPNGAVRGFAKVTRDITERRQTEEEIRNLNEELERRVADLAAVNQELEAFSYSVSHDLRAPLRGIAGFGQALEEDYGQVLDTQGKDYLRRIHAATQRMTQLIDDLLTLSRVTRSDMSRDTVVDLSAIARSIAVQLQSVQPDRRVKIVITPGMVTHGDPRLLRIALENLLGNAWKFTAQNPDARIEFTTAGTEQGKRIYLVRDNGAGFDMTYVNKLFGPFQRLHSATEFPGTGIGLATVQRIIRRHGGRVWAESVLGQGATFYFTL